MGVFFVVDFQYFFPKSKIKLFCCLNVIFKSFRRFLVNSFFFFFISFTKRERDTISQQGWQAIDMKKKGGTRKYGENVHKNIILSPPASNLPGGQTKN
ncbi:unnamed protein product [Meloidogyne enterolobii]|uniref:Uncharacterized protein n=1 Tax=Meloidogyne enterolobii TaxID=390850 RepID=A0ACB1AA97_MELEN